MEKLNRNTRTNIAVYIADIQDASKELNGPTDISELFDDVDDEQFDESEVLQDADVQYMLGYVQCAADVLGIDPGDLVAQTGARPGTEPGTTGTRIPECRGGVRLRRG